MASNDAPQDAYVFVSSGTEAMFGALRSLVPGQVRYVARLLSGAYGALVFLEVPAGDIEELQKRIAAVRDLVNPSGDVGVALQTGPRAPTRWSRKHPVGAYVRIRAESGLAGAVFEAVNELYDPEHPDDPQSYAGSALVIGGWDVLLELGASSLYEMKRLLLERVVPIPGILWTDTALVINDPEDPARRSA